MVPVQIQEKDVRGKDNRIIRYTRIQSDSTSSRSIAFFCPGASYLFDKPLLHYSTMLFLNHKIDLVHIHYSYGRENRAFWELPLEERSAWMQEDVRAVVEQVLAENTPENILFVGKSIGTMPIVEGFLPLPAFTHSIAFLLTPILTSLSLTNCLLRTTQPIFLAIGTEDHFYSESMITEIQQSAPNVHLHLVPGANHSLEREFDVHASILELQVLMREMSAFLATHFTKPTDRRAME